VDGIGTAAGRRARRLAVLVAASAALAATACRGGSPAPAPGSPGGPPRKGAAGLDANRGSLAARHTETRPPSFPSWEERVLHEWTNRARADPAAELAGCPECPDRGCYSPAPPLEWSLALNRSARFHADEMLRQDFFLHDSQCRIANDIDARYPQACDGSRPCACQGAGAMRFSDRLRLFGVERPSGEVQADHPNDPDSTFHYLLYEPASSPACASGAENGHRWNLLKLVGTVGFGVSGSYTVGDFGRSPGPGRAVASGAHYPRQADTVEFWASWYAPAGPSAAFVEVDGACTAMALTRGGPANGAWSASVSGIGGGCHRYVFVFRDANGTAVAYPDKGSFGVGREATCPDWDESRPAGEPACP
jgi:hypothetical protein